jgi:putative transposase
MAKYGLVSKYVTARSKHRNNRVNEEPSPNLVNRDFTSRAPMEVVVSDLTYVRVSGKWHYVCMLIDLSSREIIGYAAGKNKDAKLVRTAFYRVKGDLRKIQVFHTDRGSEFKNEIIENIVTAFGIERSLSAKGTPVDNAVAESMYNTLKIEMVFGNTYNNIEDLEIQLFEYVNWYNNIRLHGTLEYRTPAEHKMLMKKA